jgi:hypothetical protein
MRKEYEKRTYYSPKDAVVDMISSVGLFFCACVALVGTWRPGVGNGVWHSSSFSVPRIRMTSNEISFNTVKEVI